MERFGIETRGVYETPWFAYHGPAGEFILLKSVTYPTEGTADEYPRTVGLACSPFQPSIRFMYHVPSGIDREGESHSADDQGQDR
jgi:hypothetical protein